MTTVVRRSARTAAAVMSIVLMLSSLILINRIAFFGLAIGGWTGLNGYEQAIANARDAAHSSMVYLIVAQCIGGSLAFLAFRRGLSMASLPVFIVGYSAATFVILWIYIEVAGVLH